MLDAFIIEELKRRERQQDRPQPEAPVPDERDERPPQKSGSDDEKPQRGVVIIDYSLG